MWQSSLWYIFPTALAVLLCFVIAWHAWRLRPRRGAGYVALLMLVVAWWSLTSIFEIVSSTLPSKLCWVKIEYPAIAFIGIAWFLLMREYLGQAPRLSRRALAGTCLIPTLTVLLAWTNGWHHLMYTRAYLDTRFTIPILVFERGIWFWLFYVYLCGLVLLGVAYGLQGWLYAHPLYRRQLLAMLGGGFFPSWSISPMSFTRASHHCWTLHP